MRFVAGISETILRLFTWHQSEMGNCSTFVKKVKMTMSAHQLGHHEWHQSISHAKNWTRYSICALGVDERYYLLERHETRVDFLRAVVLEQVLRDGLHRGERGAGELVRVDADVDAVRGKLGLCH